MRAFPYGRFPIIRGIPKLWGGRVKTLHPKVLGGILALLPEQREEMLTNDIVPIDLVAVNLYPFREVAAKPPCHA